MSFKKFNFNKRIHSNIEVMGYTKPTPIQARSIQPIMENKDVMGLAQTGTGKTAAFVLPILQRLTKEPGEVVRALIISPTRELTEQTQKVIEQLGRKTGIKGVSIYGGVNIGPQIKALKRGVDIVAACPGRLLDHIRRGTVDVSRVDVLVLDEADHMFDMGFLTDIKIILGYLPSKRQTLMFSATMPKDIKVLADKILNNPVTVTVNHVAPVSSVEHSFYPVEFDRKTDLLKNLLDTHDVGPVLVFTRTKVRAKRVAQNLDKSGYEATALHGNLTQNKRRKALDGFGRGRYKILVATDVAARGIDVRGVSHVINYDMPDTVDAYTHRIGRTGRASETGEAFTFVTGSDKAPAESIKRILGKRLINCCVEEFICASSSDEQPQRKTYGRSRNTDHYARSKRKARVRTKAKFRSTKQRGASPS